MQKSLFRKGLVIGIIVLFVGASVVPSIAGYDKDVGKTNYISNENETDDYNNLMKQIIENGVISTDDWLEQAKLLASDGEGGENFGIFVSIYGDYAVIGAGGDDDNGQLSGSAYVFKRDGSEWVQQDKLLASDGAASDFFGASVSIYGDYALVGAYADDDNGFASGSAYVFKRDGTDWVQQDKLLASDGEVGDVFGRSVSIYGDYAVIGAYGDDDNAPNSGSAYVFKRDGTDWVQQDKLLASDGGNNDFFGRSISIYGDYAVIGADGDDDNGPDSGAAYVFNKSGGNQPPNPPNLISPGTSTDTGYIVDTKTPTFQWNSVQDADHYALYISKYPYGAENLVFDSEEDYSPIYETSFDELPEDLLNDGEKYRWNMRAYNSIGWSGFSDYLYFEIDIPPECNIILKKDGTEIEDIIIGDTFDICVTDYSDDITEVRFLSDENQNGKVDDGFSWTIPYDWELTSGDWSAETKTMKWSFATGGAKEVWVEVRNNDGISRSHANIYASQPVVITSPLIITSTSEDYPYFEGDELQATFSITNIGIGTISLKTVVVGGRNQLGEVVDFEKAHDVTLNSGETYNYQGYLTLPDITGIPPYLKYHFFCTYQNYDDSWNTNVDVEINGKIITNFDEAKRYRERDIIVFEKTYIEPALPTAVWEKIEGPWDFWPKPLGSWNEPPKMAINPNKPEEIYVSVTRRTDNWWEDQGSKLYKSADGGDSWSQITNGLPQVLSSGYYWPISAIAIAPSNPDIVYLGTAAFSPYSSIIAFGRGVYKSIDSGSNWVSVGGPGNIFNDRYSVSTIVVSPNDPDRVYVGTVKDGIWRTTNGGVSWDKIWTEPINKDTLLDVNALAVSSVNPNVIYAAAYNFEPQTWMGWSLILIPNRLIRSEDGGDSWEKLSLGLVTAVPKIDDIVVDSEDANKVYVITEYFKVYKSIDGGNNWEDATGSNGDDPLPDPTFFGYNMYGSSNTIELNHEVSDVIYAARYWEFSGVYFTPNSGENWFKIGPKDVYVKELKYASDIDSRILHVSTSDGFYKIDFTEGLLEIELDSPCELRVYDSQGRVTGLVNGNIKEEIPESTYNETDEIVTIIFPTDNYSYEVIGLESGEYELNIVFVKNEAIIFNANNIPMSLDTIHKYSINWTALSQGEKGVTLHIDSDGDGTFERTITSDSELTHDEFMLQTATTIDIDPDTLNLNSKGKWITCYIELPEGYDVENINISTILLNDIVPAEDHPTNIGDYDNDGIPDLMVKFNRQAVQDILEAGDNVEITVTGEITDGTLFEGTDYIRVI